ncbi:MAG: CBS domain-containing protein [Absicoccus sp.]|uniref:CBS domain-containing protein n=1 Tax=Absicoccus sp. TaxID=2718527 RepID=UPI002A757CDE|nr:CBS domain-containing protein [Absicoccus sp.]MDY3036433.1 CBS domain-containing protein [Absicoccus sp.]
MLDNVFFFLRHKEDVLYLYNDMSVSEALEILERYHFTALPVINKEGNYVGTLSEGDFLYYCLNHEDRSIPIKKLIRKNFNPACTITTPVAELFKRSLDQNFVPIVDDRNIFIGIVTRKRILTFLMKQLQDHKSNPSI